MKVNTPNSNMLVIYDNLATAKRLKSSGLPEQAAESIADEFKNSSEHYLSHFSTKVDLHNTEHKVTQHIEKIEHRLVQRIDKVENKLMHHIEKIEMRLVIKSGGICIIGFSLLAAWMKYLVG